MPDKALEGMPKKVIAVSTLNSGARGPASFGDWLPRSTAPTLLPEHVTPSHAVPPHTGLPLAMFHVLTAACPAVSPSRNAISAKVCSSCELHAEPRAVPAVSAGALEAVYVPQRWALVWT